MMANALLKRNLETISIMYIKHANFEQRYNYDKYERLQIAYAIYRTCIISPKPLVG